MAKADVVAQGLQDIQSAVQSFLGDFYDKAVADGGTPAAPSGVSADQEASDIAAAVKPLNDQIAALQQSASDAADQMGKLQAQIAQDAADEASAQANVQIIAKLKDQLNSLDQIVQSVIGQFAPAAPAAPAAPVDGSGSAPADGSSTPAQS